MIDRFLNLLLVRGVPNFITGDRRTAFVAGWAGMTLGLWLCGVPFALVHHGGIAEWIGVALIPPCLGWLASLALNPLRPKPKARHGA